MTTIGARLETSLASVVFFGLALMVAVLRPAFEHGWNLRAVTAGMIDFALNVYYPSRAFLDGVSPYDRATYLSGYPVDTAFPPYMPVTLLLHLPFAWLPFHESALVYLFMSVALVTLLAWLSLRFSGGQSSLSMVLVIAALIVLSRPGRQLLVLGQPAIEFILASYLALYYAHRAPIVSGLGLALTLIKPTFGLPLAALMLVRSRNNTAVAFGATFSMLINLPVLTILAFRAGSGSALWHDLVDTLRANQQDLSFWVVNPATSFTRVDITSLISRIVGYPLNAPAQLAVMLAVLTLAAVAIHRSERSRGDHSVCAMDSILCLAILLSVYHQAYDLLLLTMPFAVVTFRRLPTIFNTKRFRLLLLGLYAMLAANYASSVSVLTRFHLLSPGYEPTSPTGGLWLLLVSLNGVALVLSFVLYLVGVLRTAPASGRYNPSAGRERLPATYY